MLAVFAFLVSESGVGALGWLAYAIFAPLAIAADAAFHVGRGKRQGEREERDGGDATRHG